ncbi:MAG: hypothetical protein LBM12_02225 [Candidatus Nomurabacteria bacterium]|jgi:hypothetical protein|nr:hypothetical protein [Candidatus Nomurabacteria bacterium]
MSKVVIEKELGAIPSKAEMEVVDILVLNNIVKKSVKFLKPNRVKGSKTPDLLMDGNYWEIKSIEKLGKYTLAHAERTGLEQADNLIFDLRKLAIKLEDKAAREIQKEFEKRKGWRGLLMIVRPGDKVLTFQK